MDIRDWSLDKIMQLPDCAFGRRWPVACAVESSSESDVYAIVETGVPDRAVIWEICFSGPVAVTLAFLFEFAWADALVTSPAQWSALQKMFPCQGIQDGVDFNLSGPAGSGPALRALKLPAPAAGLRPSMRVDMSSTTDKIVVACFVVSSMPREVPDCLFSGIR